MSEKVIASDLQEKVRNDDTKYNLLDAAYAMFDDFDEQLAECIKRHDKKFDEDEYFICIYIVTDMLIESRRHLVYTADLYLPDPRPRQAVLLYNKKTGKIQKLWSLPKAEIMVALNASITVPKKWESTKRWCDYFFNFTFFDDIRKEYNIDHLTKREYLEANREKLIKASGKNVTRFGSDAFDFSKVIVKEVVDPKPVVPFKNSFNPRREA